MEIILGANSDLITRVRTSGLWEECQSITAKYTRELKQTHRASLEKIRREHVNKPAASSAKDGASIRREIASYSRKIHVYNVELKRDIAALEKGRDEDIVRLLDGVKSQSASTPEHTSSHLRNKSPTLMYIKEEPDLAPGRSVPSRVPANQRSTKVETMEIEQPTLERVQGAVPAIQHWQPSLRQYPCLRDR